MNEVIELFEKTFRVNKNGCPWGSCTEDFLLGKAIETIEGSDLGISDKENLIDIFKANMYHGLGRFSNGKHAGKWYINLIKEYFNNMSENNNSKRYEAVCGFNSKQWWAYDNETDEYCDPPLKILNDITTHSDSIDEQEKYFNELLKQNPDWLYDEDYRYNAEDYDI